MFRLPPPKESIHWSFGLMTHVCFAIGLGKPGRGKWTLLELSDALEHGDPSTIGNWPHGGGINDQNLKDLVRTLTNGEDFPLLWKKVIEHTSLNIRSKDEIEDEIDDYFGIDKFPQGERAKRKEIDKYLENADFFSEVSEIDLEIKKARHRKSLTKRLSDKNLLVITRSYLIAFLLLAAVITSLYLVSPFLSNWTSSKLSSEQINDECDVEDRAQLKIKCLFPEKE